MTHSPLAERLRRHRARRAATGLRLSQRWVYDMRDPVVLDEIEQECRAIAADDKGEAEIERWLDAVRDTDGWT